MTKQEAIEAIKMAIAQVEWEYPMDYAVAFDMAIEALSQPEIVRCKDCKHSKRYVRAKEIISMVASSATDCITKIGSVLMGKGGKRNE